MLSEEQTALEDFCTRLLEKEWPLEKALAALKTGGPGHSPELWKVLVEAGWLGLPFAAEYGGAGGDLVDLGLVYRAAGKALVPSSFYACMFAALLINRIGTDAQKKALLPGIIAGEKLVTVASGERQAPEDIRFITTAARRTGGGWTIEGAKAFVPYADIADAVIVLAKLRDNVDRGGIGLFVIESAQLKGRSRRQEAMGGDALFELTLDAVEVSAGAMIGDGGETLAAYEDVLEQATALQTMEMAGGTAAVLERTAAYVNERKQQGRQIGSFQAVQHLMANGLIQQQGASVAALKAVYDKSKGRAATRSVSIAKIAMGEAYSNVTITAQQVWGAMGFARETGIYLWTERAKVTDAWLGTRATHLRRLATNMGL